MVIIMYATLTRHPKKYFLLIHLCEKLDSWSDILQYIDPFTDTSPTVDVIALLDNIKTIMAPNDPKFTDQLDSFNKEDSENCVEMLENLYATLLQIRALTSDNTRDEETARLCCYVKKEIASCVLNRLKNNGQADNDLRIKLRDAEIELRNYLKQDAQNFMGFTPHSGRENQLLTHDIKCTLLAINIEKLRRNWLQDNETLQGIHDESLSLYMEIKNSLEFLSPDSALKGKGKSKADDNDQDEKEEEQQRREALEELWTEFGQACEHYEEQAAQSEHSAEAAGEPAPMQEGAAAETPPAQGRDDAPQSDREASARASVGSPLEAQEGDLPEAALAGAANPEPAAPLPHRKKRRVIYSDSESDEQPIPRDKAKSTPGAGAGAAPSGSAAPAVIPPSSTPAARLFDSPGQAPIRRVSPPQPAPEHQVAEPMLRRQEIPESLAMIAAAYGEESPANAPPAPALAASATASRAGMFAGTANQAMSGYYQAMPDLPQALK
jgi:hypothetical protein